MPILFAQTLTSPRARRGFAATALALACLGWLAGGGGSSNEARGQVASGANIILLFTDDQEPASLRVMRTVRKELQRKGTTMRRFYANFPLCCPARTTMLTGQYAHNHGVLSNKAPDGGYGVFNARHGQNNLPIWLRQAGYTTGFMGKFMNEYAEPDSYGTLPVDVPAGWDEWRALAPARAQYFGYTLNQNGVLTQFSEQEEDYSTDVFTTKAKRWIRRVSRNPNPYFLTLGYAAPHGGGGGEPGRSCNRAAIPAPRHLATLRDGKRDLPLAPSFNEADVSDKPKAIQNIPPLTPNQVSDVTRKRRCAWESLLAVDESVGEIIDEVKKSGERRNTYVFFTSDNGYLRGEHRIRNNKRFLYEESARVPFVARGPGIARGAESDDVVVNADLTATILDISGATPGLLQDGESLMPSLANPELENGRAILLEAYAGQEILGVRTSRYLYTEWENDDLLGSPEIELYDTYVDPHQLNNLAGNSGYSGVVADLAGELDALIKCAGADCRTRPSAQLAVHASATGPNLCVVPPLTASVTSPQEREIVSVSFRAGRLNAGTDTVAPFEVPLPERGLREALPKSARVSAKVLFRDGRRLGVATRARACG